MYAGMSATALGATELEAEVTVQTNPAKGITAAAAASANPARRTPHPSLSGSGLIVDQTLRGQRDGNDRDALKEDGQDPDRRNGGQGRQRQRQLPKRSGDQRPSERPRSNRSERATGWRAGSGPVAPTTGAIAPIQIGAPVSPIWPSASSRPLIDGKGIRPDSRSEAGAGALGEQRDPPRRQQDGRDRDGDGRRPPGGSGRGPSAGPGSRRFRRSMHVTSAASSHIAGAKQVTSVNSIPVRHPALQRRWAAGSAKPRAAWASQGSRAALATIPNRPALQAPEVTHVREYADAPMASIHGGMPRSSRRCPTTRSSRHEPQNASGTDSTISAEIIVCGPPGNNVPDSAKGNT